MYTALSKMRRDNTRPSNGSLIECAKCENEFSVVRVTFLDGMRVVTLFIDAVYSSVS